VLDEILLVGLQGSLFAEFVRCPSAFRGQLLRGGAQ
jgi:hypothetical protein